MKPEDIKNRTDLLAFILEHQSDIPLGMNDDGVDELLSEVSATRKAEFILCCLDGGALPGTNTYGVPKKALIFDGDRA